MGAGGLRPSTLVDGRRSFRLDLPWTGISLFERRGCLDPFGPEARGGAGARSVEGPWDGAQRFQEGADPALREDGKAGREAFEVPR
mgnify:CR=1 FL=1